MQDGVAGSKKVSFTRMDLGTREDRDIIATFHESELTLAAEHCLSLLKKLRSPPGRAPWRVDRFTHSLQTATRAFRDGADEELTVVALLHDIGDAVSLENHAFVSAEILRPYISDRNYWLVRHHGLFQTRYYGKAAIHAEDRRAPFFDHPYFAATEKFCRDWDQMSFDPDYDTLSLDFFEPFVRSVLARPVYSESALFESLHSE